MKPKTNKETSITRRSLFPILGGSFLLPFFGIAQPIASEIISSNEDEEEYTTLLKSDGTSVKVKTSTFKNAKIVKQNVSNTSLLNWLGKKL